MLSKLNPLLTIEKALISKKEFSFGNLKLKLSADWLGVKLVV
jgi:hypothetical protein